MTQESRPSVLSNVKQQLRQEAGFGCCRCGHPFIQYHHIIPWAEEQHFRPEDMMVLCGQCHPLCTVGALDEAQQRAIKSRPKNVVDGLVNGALFTKTKELAVRMGQALAIETPNLIVIKDEPVLSARRDPEDGRILVSARICDRAGELIGVLEDNEWSLISGNLWDFEAYPLRAIIRNAPRDIALCIDARGPEILIQGHFYHHDRPVVLTPSMIKIGNGEVRQITTMHSRNFIRIDY